MTVEELVETFELLGDWEERYRYLIELGRKLEPLPAAEHNENTRVRGCMSQVWLTARVEAGSPPRLHFLGDSDAHLVKGLIALLFGLVSGKTAPEIVGTDLASIFRELGLENHITMNRRNGFYAMVERIKGLAAHPPSAELTTSSPA
jgi:cysteine desulfuration protein SufE